MKDQDNKPTWKISFRGGETMIMTEDKIDSPTIKRAIRTIQQTFACCGLTLMNGIQVERV